MIGQLFCGRVCKATLCTHWDCGGCDIVKLGGDYQKSVEALMAAVETTSRCCEFESSAKKGSGKKRQLLEWQRLQQDLRSRLVECDTKSWQTSKLTCNCAGNVCESSDGHLRFCGGVDISFVKGDDTNACATLVVIDIKDYSVVYENSQMVRLTAPYIPGYLAFREVGFYEILLEALRQTHPDLFPQVILVDGNGQLHPRFFGIACHLGVLTDVPTIGVAKTLINVEGLKREPIGASWSSGRECGTVGLFDESNKLLGAEVKAVPGVTNPVYVSVGHGISLETALWVIRTASKYRLPEPVRQADILSRKYIREKWTPTVRTA